jgi:hypothetical protein
MKSGKRAKTTLEAEVQNVSKFGVWILVRGNEYFLSYKDYPWFKKATNAAVKNVRLLNEDHLQWPDLDVDLEVESLEKPQKYPLKFRTKR